MLKKDCSINGLGTNEAIKFNLDEDKLKSYGFRYLSGCFDIPPYWHYHSCKNIEDLELTFNVDYYYPRQYKNANLEILTIDEDFGQPYDYQHILEKNPNNAFALKVKEWVEKEMEDLEYAGIISGHNLGDYI